MGHLALSLLILAVSVTLVPFVTTHALAGFTDGHMFDAIVLTLVTVMLVTVACVAVGEAVRALRGRR